MVDSREELVELVACGGVAGDNEDSIVTGDGTKDEFFCTTVNVVGYRIGEARAGLDHSKLTTIIHTIDRHLCQIAVDTQHFLLHQRINRNDILERAIGQDFLLGTQVV